MTNTDITLKDLNGNKVFTISEGETIIGRGSKAQISLADTVLSREHAVIRRKGLEVWVKDLESTNGTKLNYGSVGKETPMKHGDVLSLGEQELQIVFPGGGEVERPKKQGAADDNYVAMNSMGGKTTLKQAFSLPSGWSNEDKGKFSEAQAVKPSADAGKTGKPKK